VRQLLVNEAAAGQAVASRHVVHVERAEQEASPPFNLLEWIDGQTLELRLAQQRRMPAGTAVWIARQCAQGLNDLAGVGYAHGDVKPQNIFVGDGGEVKLIDLGFAQPLAESPPTRHSHSMTGTPEYMAPESFSRGIINPVLRDIYSLGVTLYQMLSGRLPFESTNTRQVLRLHCTTRPPRLESLCEGVPADLFDLVRRLLAKQPIRRPQSYASLIRELTSLELATLHARYAA
jgi:serine/threonine protein kinase